MSGRRRHSEEFKQNAVRRMLSSGKTASEVARELGLHPTQLFRWRQQMSHIAAAMPDQENDTSKARRPQDWTPEEKLEAVLKSQSLTETEMGAFLRARGLHKADLDEWRESVLRGARAELGGTAGGSKSREQKRIRELERELHRKDKALAEASALLVLKKKAQAIWGAEDDDTDPTSER